MLWNTIGCLVLLLLNSGFKVRGQECRDYGDDGNFCKDTFDELPELDIEVTFRLFTKYDGTVSDTQNYGALISAFSTEKPTKIITHGFKGAGADTWVVRIVDELLQVGDFNVIVVDWEEAADPGPLWFEYDKASSNTRIVASRLTRFLWDIYNATQHAGGGLHDVHLIGHSLGAQISAMAGKWIQRDYVCGNTPCKLSRITALDPARPNFLIQSGSDYVPGPFCLSSDDADFVDVIHTDSSAEADNGGLFFLKYGIYQALGHADFYPSGGKDQPGCSEPTCDHSRAYELFAASINSYCQFEGLICSSHAVLQENRCLECTSPPCNSMGYYANKPITSTIYNVVTTSTEPFCEDLMYPYGPDNYDEMNERNDDGSSAEIFISTPFPFFNHTHVSLWVNTNGIISFLGSVGQYTPEAFPLGDNRRVVSPFWTDVDTTNGGDVYYREVTNPADGLLERGTNEIRQAFPSHSQFSATWMFVATWDEVAFYGASETGRNKRNTFQCVLVTNGRHSFAIYNYHDITWTTGSASGGDSNTGLGGTPAQVGFDAGDNVTYYMVDGSRTNDIINIDKQSNVGISGRFVFSVDNANIEAGGCNTEGVVSIYPTSGSMLGGESVQVHGPCLNNIDRLRCKFGDYETRGTLVASKVMCNTPIFYEAGRVEFRLSLDDGDTYDDYRGIFTVVSPEYVEPSIQRINSPNWHLSHETDVTITWDMTSIEAIQLHVFIFGYVENGGSVSLEMAERITATPIDNTGSYTFAKQQQQYADFHIGAIRIVDANSSLSGYPRSLWSDIHNLQWKYEAESVQFCREWLSSPNEQDTSFLDDLLPCPCTRQQARVDIGRYEPHPRCNDDSSDIINCHLKPAAVHCIRVNEPSGNGAGQECCYNNDGNLVDGSDGNSGGTSHRYHHGGVSPYKSPGKVPYLSHYLADLLPWEHCCLYQQSDTMCFDYYDKRPSDGCQQYQPPRPSGGIGDPHIHTLDGTPYTFNGQGEFSLMKTTGNSFSMQGRMQPLTADSQATVFTAVVMKAASTDTVQIEVNNRGDLVAWIASLSDGSWKTVNFEERGSWPFTGVTVTKDQLPETESITITAVFVTSGISVQFTASSGIMMMSFVLIAPQTLMSNTQGLLGTWNNDPDDDFTRPDGVYISTTLSLHDIHYHFGMHWNVSIFESLFRYDVAESWHSMNNYNYTPLFDIPENISQEIIETCGGNSKCIYDYVVTGDRRIATMTRQADNEYKQFVQDSKAVISCGFPGTPINGNKTATNYTEGGIVWFECKDGYHMTGTKESQCLEDGSWSSATPYCEEKSLTNLFWVLGVCVATFLLLVIIISIACCVIHVCCKSPKDKLKIHPEGA